jgi:adenine-specific DNA methylase
MNKPKKLIEVAMPIKEISAESVRDKSIRHGHISTLHLWWARRPLPVCRAVVFASLVPDPEDTNCPQSFKDAVELLLGKNANPGDPYTTYSDIPWTSVFDPMADNLRNRLQMFIGKFTQSMQDHLLGKTTKPQAGKMLTDESLIKWDSKNDEKIINKARKLIWVAHNSDSINTAAELLADFDKHYKAIKEAENELYSLTDRHIETDKGKQLTDNLHNAIEAFLNKMPKVFDPFAGGGAIPLEAARLGCRSFGNDINPVAHIIQKGSLEFPQKYGKPISYSLEEFIKLYGEEEFNNIPNENRKYHNGNVIGVNIDNRLSFDVEYYCKKLLKQTDNEIGYLYPEDKNGNRPIAYYWVRVGTCSNPSCKAEVPLLKSFYLVNTPTKKIYLYPTISEKLINFEIKYGKYNEKELIGWNERANLRCPCCGSFTDTKTLKKQFFEKSTSERLIAVIEDGNDGKDGKRYRLPFKNEIEVIKNIPLIERPNELMPQNDSQNLKIPFWGFKCFGDMFTNRQLLSIQTFINKLEVLQEETSKFSIDYNTAINTYLAIFIDRIIQQQTSFGLIKPNRESFASPFGRQAIPMVFDFPEVNPFCTSSGSALNQLDWIKRYLHSESHNSFSSISNNASSGDKSQFPDKFLTSVVTDPPYYDAIAYADLSDFFYIWLKKTLNKFYPLNFATPQTPKTEECTATKHYHNNNKENAKKHFEKKLSDIFDAIEHQTSDIVSIMFAHQSTDAWTTLCNSILGARMNITGSWAIDSEMANRNMGLSGAALQSSVTVSCVPSQSEGYGDYKEVKKAIETTVAREVDELYRLGFRGADLLTACFGQAVSEFGKYKKVEKADGSEVTVAELLKMARESAFNALLKGFDGDEYTKFYIGWMQLNGFSESDFDDAATFAKAGLSINVAELFREHILIQNKNKQTLATFGERNKLKPNLGAKSDSFLIDQVHKAMQLFKGTNRNALLDYIKDKASAPDGSFWRVVTSLDELLPKDCEDQKMTKGLLTNKESLIRESKETQKQIVQQGTLELE